MGGGGGRQACFSKKLKKRIEERERGRERRRRSGEGENFRPRKSHHFAFTRTQQRV